MKPSKVSDLLGKINRLAENADFSAISKIELDLLKQHIRNLYDEVDAVTVGTTMQPAESEPTHKEPAPDPTFLKRKPIMHANDNMLLAEQPEAGKVAEFLKKVMVTAPEVKPVVEKAEPEIKMPEAKVQKKEAPAITSSINESVKSAGSLNEKLKTNSAVEMHKKLSSKPLKELIDLNKRFVLLSDLFKGNADAYYAAIAHIDTLPDYASAQDFINTQLVTNYFWDEAKQSTRMFTKLVKMKYGVE